MLKIITNNVPRPLIYGYELTDSEKEDFEYINASEIESSSFFRYKGEVYDPNEFMCIDSVMILHHPEFKAWDGYQSDSYFSGILINYDNNCEAVIVATYTS